MTNEELQAAERFEQWMREEDEKINHYVYTEPIPKNKIKASRQSNQMSLFTT
jgi:uncharacterized protein YaeQ